MNYDELKLQVENAGFVKSKPKDLIGRMPLDKEIVLIPVRTRAQAELCLKFGIEVYERTIPNGLTLSYAPMDFKTIITAISKYRS